MTDEWLHAENPGSDDLYELWLQSLRGIRHDTMNDIQILSGYLTMNKPEEGRQYIEKLAQRMQQEGLLVHLNYAPLSVYLLTFNHMTDGLYLEVELNEPFSVRQLTVGPEKFTQWIVRCLGIYRQHVRQELSGNEDASPALPANQLLMSWDRREQELAVTLDFVGDLDETPFLQAMRRFSDALRNEQIRFVEGLHSNRESVFTFYVPLRGGASHEIRAE